MTAHPSPISRRALACLLAGLGLPAGAIGLGELRVHSSLGEPLDATVSLAMPAEAKPRPDCFSLGRLASPELPAISRATFTVEPDGAAWRVRIRTRAIVEEPALRMRLNAACEPQEAASRDYDILVDPRPAEAPAPALRTLAGDTLESLATAIYPKRRAVRDAYVRALQAANPPLAALAPGEPIPPGSAVVLPDLRRFSLSLAVSPPAARPSLPVARPGPKVAKAPPAKAPIAKAPAAKAPETPKAPPPEAAKAPAPEPPPAKAPAPAARSGAFVLRLSSPAVDLSRSRGIDDRTRAQLRERLLILDADDQVSALLAMRNSLKQLEGRVAELQLKLSTLPATAAPAVPPAAPAPAAPPAPAPAASPVPAPATVSAPPPDKPLEPAKPPVAPKPAAKAPIAAAPEPAPPPADEFPAWIWAVIALAVVAFAVLAWRQRPRKKAEAPETPPAAAVSADLDEAEAMMRTREDPPAQAHGEHRVVASSDAGLATSVRGADPTALRRRYIEERFPEIASGTIAPDSPDSVVKAARLFYEDGALARAVELLQYSVEENPASLKPWLALFEIFRLEGLTGEFAELAGRFQSHHGATDFWRKVQFIGRELDPANPLYREAPVNQLETIGPAASRRLAPVTFDPLAENWLNAPMDFTTDALAASLRSGLLADAGIADGDLIADPLPALKNVEMFNVA